MLEPYTRTVREQQAVVVQQQRGVRHELEARRVRRGHHGDPKVEHVARARAQQRGALGVAGARVFERLVQQLQQAERAHTHAAALEADERRRE
eukprot:scaffold112449_cov30-Phaeocystis_antarctica.AAC.1